MIKVNFKKVLACAVLLFSTAFIISCSNDSNPSPSPTPPPTGGNIDVAIGTFKGKLTIYPPNNVSEEYFDAIVMVAADGSGKLKVSAKLGEEYSIMTPKTFKVDNISGAAVSEIAGSIEGVFLYKIDIKTLKVVTQEQSATEVTFSFDGEKQ